MFHERSCRLWLKINSDTLLILDQYGIRSKQLTYKVKYDNVFFDQYHYIIPYKKYNPDYIPSIDNFYINDLTASLQSHYVNFLNHYIERPNSDTLIVTKTENFGRNQIIDIIILIN